MNEYWAYCKDPSYLSHFGIPGMKWGVRRYQKKDGSRTPAGRKRYKTTTLRERQNMTEAEMDRRISRLEKEKRLRDLERDVARGEARKILSNSAKVAAGTLITAGLIYGGKKTIKYAAVMAGYDGDAIIKDMFPKKK